MKSWFTLKPGDVVDVVAPGSGTRPEELAAALEFLRKWQLQPRVSETLLGDHPYLAHEDRFRFQDLKKALSAKDSKMVFCLRGGYGTIRLMPQLLKLKAPSQAKMVVGYSDITTLHLFLNGKWKWVSCHGPLLDGLAHGKHSEDEVEELRQILFGEHASLRFGGLTPFNKSAEKFKKASGTLSGGNLMVLSGQCGTKLSPKFRGQIVILEEISERGYRVDRMLTQLTQSGAFEGVKAVLLGSFLGGEEKSGQNYVRRALSEWAREMKFPVMLGLPSGHDSKNRPLLFGEKAGLEKEAVGFCLSQDWGEKPKPQGKKRSR